jgi:hypothetical protein
MIRRERPSAGSNHRTRRCLIAIALTLSSSAPVVLSCETCGCYTPQQHAPFATAGPDLPLANPNNFGSRWTSGPYAAIAEQFTYFGTLQLNGIEVSNPTDQHLDSSITQLVIGYGFNDRLALQINLPVIYRWYQRPQGFVTDRGSESGIGDLSLLANLVLIHLEKGGGRSVAFHDPKSPRIEITQPTLTFSLSLFSGLKMPTGDSSRLEEEFHEIEIPGAPKNAIHGHDLTLGTGSWDGIFGGQAAVRYRDMFFHSELQFTLRGDGDHQYHFANDLSWSGGPGYYLLRGAHTVVGVQAVVSGDYKDVDRFRGKVADDTGMTSVFVGPRVIASFGKISAEIEADLPVSIDNTALQVVPDYRIRGGISLHF